MKPNIYTKLFDTPSQASRMNLLSHFGSAALQQSMAYSHLKGRGFIINS